MPRMWVSALAAGALAALATQSSLAATIAPTAQARSVSATASIDFGEVGSDFVTQSDFAPDFSTFNVTVSADPNGQLNWPGIGSTAFQFSEILNTSIIGQGSATAGANPGGPVTGVSADGSSDMSVTFTIASNTNYNLSGSIDAGATGASGFGEAQVTLTGPGGTVFTLTTTNGQLLVSDAGLLTPGSYTLSASAVADMAFGEDAGNASFDIVFTIPEPTAVGGLLIGFGLLLTRRR